MRMILPESQPFVWDEAARRSHIESVLMAIGCYEGAAYVVRRSPLSNFPWRVYPRYLLRINMDDAMLYTSMDDAIASFLALESSEPAKQQEQAAAPNTTSSDSGKEKRMGYYAEYEVVRGRQVYHVVPAEKGWEVKKEGNKRPSAKARLKKEAIDCAKALAKKAKLGQIIIHKKDGTIQTEHTYGKDPRKTKG